MHMCMCLCMLFVSIVQADAVFSVTKAPTLAGVAGTGGACATDGSGRPTWLVFTWIQDATGMAGTTEQLVAKHRGPVAMWTARRFCRPASLSPPQVSWPRLA